MNDCFSIEYKNITTEILKKYNGTIGEILSCHKDNEDISSYPAGDLSDLIYASEEIALSARANAEEAEKDPVFFYEQGFEKLSLMNFPCRMEFDGETFTLSTPYTIKRRDSKSKIYQKENYQFLSYVKAEITRFGFTHPDVQLKFNDNFTHGGLVMIVARYAKKVNPSVHCDHDNLENGRIQNAICSALGISDRCDVMDYYSIFRFTDRSEDAGMKFIVTSRKNLIHYV